MVKNNYLHNKTADEQLLFIIASTLCPTYIVDFELGRGFRLLGSDLLGDLGHLANSIHPDCKDIKQNARFATEKKFSLDKETLCRARLFKPGNYGKFPIISTKSIKKGDEIIVNYGKFYWPPVQSWSAGYRVKRSLSATSRDERLRKRSEKKQFVGEKTF
jgi:hypothetical protein